MKNKLKKVGLAALLGLNLVAVNQMSNSNCQKMGNHIFNDAKSSKFASRAGGGAFWQGVGAGIGALAGGGLGTWIGGPWGGYIGGVIGAGAGAY